MMKKVIMIFIKNNLWKIILVIPVILAAIILIVVYPTYKNAESLGNAGGALYGNAAGRLVGSVDGVTNGLAEGADDGKMDALSAKDTEVRILGRVQELGNLEVLSVNMKRNGINSADGGKTLVLWVTECEAVYSVDLTKAKIISENDKCTVLIPYPKLSTNFQTPQKIAQYSKREGTGSSDAGSAEYINSQNEIRSKIEQELENDPDITEMANDAALSQVNQLIKNVSVKDNNKDNITVDFEEGLE